MHWKLTKGKEHTAGEDADGEKLVFIEHTEINPHFSF